MGRLNTTQEMIGLGEFKTLALYRALAAEFVGTLLLVLVSCASGYSVDPLDANPVLSALLNGTNTSVLKSAFATGIMLAAIVQCLGHVSGGHVNPAVTVAMLFAREASLIRSFLYIMVQAVGAVVGSGILYAIVPNSYQENLGILSRNEGMTEWQAFGLEVVLTYILIITIMGATDDRRTDVKGSAPLAIGLVVVANISSGAMLSGACMNPARALGPAVLVGGTAWDGHWVYWAGPVLGGVLASLMYSFVFRETKQKQQQHDARLSNSQMPLRY